MADSSGEGEEEYEYEEVEVEEEEEEYEEVEEEEEEEVVKGDEQIQEEEPEEEEEEYEEVEEEVEEEEEEEEECEEIEEEEEEEEVEEEEEYEEVEEEEEEEEEVGEEIETDAAIDEETVTEAKAIDDVIAVATEAETVIDEEMAMEAEEEAEVEDEEAEAKAKVEAIYESAFRSSNMSLPVADRSLCDVRLEEESKSNDVCSRSRLQDTVNSEVAATLDVIHAVDGTVSTLRCPSPSQQHKKETDALSIYGGVSLPERLNSVANTVETEQSPVEISPLGTTVENQQSHVIHVTPAIASEEHDFTPVGINELCKIETTDIDDKRGPVKSPLADAVKNQWTHDRCVASAVTTEEHVSAPDGTRDKICESETTDIAETRFPSQKEDPHLPPNESMDQNATRCHTPQLRPRSLSPGGASDVSNKRPAIICEFFVKGWCIKGSSCRFLHKRDQVDHSKGHVEGDKPCPSKDSGGTSGASMSRGHNQPKSLLRNSDELLPIKTGGVHTEKDYREPVHGKDNFRLLERDAMYRHLSSSSQISPSSKDSGAQMNSFHPFAMVEESVAMRRQYTLDLHSSPICTFPSRSSNSVRNSSLLDDSSWKDMLNSYKKRRFTPYNWEPSTRFRPSCLTSFAASSSDVPYDPIRDSIEQSSLGQDPFRRCSYSQTQGLAYQNDQRLHSDSNDKEDYYSRNKDAGVVEAESGAVSATNPENKITSDENNPVVAASVKDVLKSTKSISDGSSKLKIDGPRHMGETGRHKKNGLDEDEARVIKIFRAALVDFVKELLKPVWHEGRLSKDVYKVIVQKAEDKILSTLPSNEVPDTSESINLYLSTSRPNILKLIQAYVDKYGKF